MPVPKDKNGLTAKQDLFCKEYIKDFNGTRSAIAAGYSESSANAIASENLRKPDVRAYIDTLLRKRMEKVEIDANYVLQELVNCWEADLADLFTDKGELRKLSEIPRAWRRMLGGLTIKKITAGYGDDEDVMGEIISLASVDKSKYLKMLGEHTNVRAFDKTVEITGKDGGAIEITETQRAAKLASILSQALDRGSQPSTN